MPTATWANLSPDKRRRVLDAAMREFGARGFSGGSLNTVAREAGVAKGSLFQYFDDKLDLFAHVCDDCSTRVRDDMVKRIDALPPDLPLFDALRGLVTHWVAYFVDHPLERGVTFATNFEMDPDVRRAVRAVTNRHYVDVLRPLVDQAAGRGELRGDVDLDYLVALLLVLLPHLALAPSAPELDPVLDLSGAFSADLAGPLTGYIDVLERAFGPSHAPEEHA